MPRYLLSVAVALVASIAVFADVPISGPRVLCEGTASIDLLAAPGYRSYRWNTGVLNARLRVTQAGRYICYTVDSLGRADSGIVVVTAVQRPRPRIGNPIEYLCEGDIAELRAPSGFRSYQWNTGEQTPSINVSQGGTYRVTVVDTNGCTGSSDDINVIVTPRPRPAIDGVNAVCLNAVAIYQAPSEPGVQYVWSVTGGTIVGGQNTPTVRIQWQRSGRIELQARSMRPDGVACDTVIALQVRVGTRLRPELFYDRGNICDGDSIVISAAQGFRTYRWSTGESSPRIVVRREGAYFVDVEDSSGCQGTSDTVLVRVSPRPDVRVSGPAVLCPGGRVILDATSVANDVVQWQWSTGAATSSVLIDRVGTYEVIGRTINGCADTARLTIRAAIPIDIAAPATVRFDTTNVGTPVTATFVISNRSTVDAMITSLSVTPVVPGLTIAPLPPTRIGAGAAVTFTWTWTADRVGDIRAVVNMFAEQDGCQYPFAIELLGHARDIIRRGSVDVWAIDTTVPVGSNVDMPLTVATGVSAAETTDIDVLVSFDASVYHVTSVTGARIIDDRRIDHQRAMTLRLDGLALPRATDTVIVLHGQAMLGRRISIPINIERIIVSGPSIYDVTAYDGSITVTGCWLPGRRILFTDQGAMRVRVFSLEGRQLHDGMLQGPISTVEDILETLPTSLRMGLLYVNGPRGEAFGPFGFLR